MSRPCGQSLRITLKTSLDWRFFYLKSRGRRNPPPYSGKSIMMRCSPIGKLLTISMGLLPQDTSDSPVICGVACCSGAGKRRKRRRT